MASCASPFVARSCLSASCAVTQSALLSENSARTCSANSVQLVVPRLNATSDVLCNEHALFQNAFVDTFVRKHLDSCNGKKIAQQIRVSDAAALITRGNSVQMQNSNNTVNT